MKAVLLVAGGGAIGAVLRYLIALLFTQWQFNLPYHTLLANIIGCFLIGFLLNLILPLDNFEQYRLFILVGVLGGFTTFSSFSLEFLQLVQQKQLIKALSYFFITNLACLIAVYWGYITSQK